MSIFNRKKTVHSAFVSRIGSREVNEDNVCVLENGDRYCFAVCDGLGGHGLGEVASEIAVETFTRNFDSSGKEREFLSRVMDEAQETLLAEQRKINAPSKMKTTCAAVYISNGRAYIGHIGDSRVYVIDSKGIRSRTIDHSVTQMLVLSGEIEESEIRNNPERNTLLRVMGVEWDRPMYELASPVSLKKGNAFLLCSDGFWELVSDEDIERTCFESESPEEWLNQMEEIILENGTGKKMDNYSAVAVWIE